MLPGGSTGESHLSFCFNNLTESHGMFLSNDLTSLIVSLSAEFNFQTLCFPTAPTSPFSVVTSRTLGMQGGGGNQLSPCRGRLESRQCQNSVFRMERMWQCRERDSWAKGDTLTLDRDKVSFMLIGHPGCLGVLLSHCLLCHLFIIVLTVIISTCYLKSCYEGTTFGECIHGTPTQTASVHSEMGTGEESFNGSGRARGSLEIPVPES